MSLADLQREYGDFHTPRFRVTVDGQPFTDADGVIADLSVDTTLEGADTFAFTLAYPYDPEREGGTFLGLNWDLFAPDRPVEIAIGYEAPADLTTVLVGKIAAVATEFPSSGMPTVKVSGFDLLHDLTDGTGDDAWTKTTDSAVVEDVAGKDAYGFTEVVAEATGTERPRVVQNERSDYDLLKELADRNGFELFARGRTLYFRSPDYRSDPRVTLAYGRSLGSFSPEVNSAGQVDRVEVRYWNEKRKEEIVGAVSVEGDGGAGAGGEGKTRVLRARVESEAEAREVAAAALERITEGLVTGSGETVGIPALRIGETIRLEGLGSRFTKVYYTTKVTHRVGGSGYGTSVGVTESPHESARVPE